MGHFTPGFTSSKLSALQAIQALGLTTGLQLCLDVGDENSYTSGQVWSDRSGNAYDFNRGATSSSEASDPTFNGTAGQLSGNEFWSFDGGDWFTLGQANPTWVNNLHKNNAKFAIAAWIYLAAGIQDICGTAITTGDVGISLFRNSLGNLRFGVLDGSGSAALIAGTTALPASQWVFIGALIDEAASTGTLQVNTTQQAITSTYSSPSASNATNTLQIASSGEGAGGGSTPFLSGSRMAMFNAWEGTVPSAADLLALYNLTRGGRFGV